MTNRNYRTIARKISRAFTIPVLLSVSLAGHGQVLSSHAATSSSSQSSPASQTAAKPLLRVNGAVLTERDLQREIANMFPFENQHNGGLPASMEKDIRQGAAQMLVFEELVYQEAQRRHMTIAPEVMAKAEADVRKRLKTTSQYQQYLREEFHGDAKLLRARIERTLLIDKMMKLEVANKATVSMVEARRYFDTHKEEFRISESFTFQSISFMPPQNATSGQVAEAKKHADAVLKQAKATKSYEEFGVLAEKNSDDDFRVMMGDHKSADRSKLPSPVVNAFTAMQVGQVSDVVEFDKNQFTILRLNGHSPAGAQKFEEVQQALREKLSKQKTEQLRASLATSLSKNAKIEKL